MKVAIRTKNDKLTATGQSKQESVTSPKLCGVRLRALGCALVNDLAQELVAVSSRVGL